MKIHGQELWADLEVEAGVLSRPRRIVEALHVGARALGAEVLSEHVQTFQPAGLTAIVVIGESHLLASTYEELGIVAVNVQTCTAEMELLAGVAAICRELGCRRIRGLLHMRRLDTGPRILLQREDVGLVDGGLDLPDRPRAGEGRTGSADR